jgi:phosphomannomutase
MVAAEFLGADSVVVPISCNDAIDRGPLKDLLEPRTRIGSPFVIAGMEKARARGKRAVCGWEANGGFLTGSDIQRNGRVLPALPTRDAVLPILCVLLSAFERGLSVIDRFALLPARYSRAALLRDFPRTVSSRIVARFSPGVTSVTDVSFVNGGVAALNEEGALQVLSPSQIRALEAIRDDLKGFFISESGFSDIARLNYTDGIRAGFDNGEIAHVRPSGNADELRIYAVADTQPRADAIASLGIAEPEGILRRMQSAVTGCRP